jgi:uncharacterized protein (DUF2235 family)
MTASSPNQVNTDADGSIPNLSANQHDSQGNITSEIASEITSKNTAPNTKRRLVLCLDGTWNSTYELKDSDGDIVARPSNILKMARGVNRYGTDGAEQIVYYNTGVGASSQYPGRATKLLTHVDRVLGGIFGAGFHSKVEEAITFISNNYRAGDDVFIFGFSRGAGIARAVCQFIKWMGEAKCVHNDESCASLRGAILAKKDAYFVPFLLREYFESEGKTTFDNAMSEATQTQPPYTTSSFSNELIPITVKMLGVWDTVLALSSVFTPKFEHHLNSEELPLSVENAYHALAIDEARMDFLPNIWRTISQHDQSLKQRWFAGSHSNIGGGYPIGGLANCSLDWFVLEAQKYGLAFDQEYLSYFKAKPESVHYNSKSLSYKILDALRGLYRWNKGERKIGAGFQESIDISVFQRLFAKNVQSVGFLNSTHTPLLYRPNNLKDYFERMLKRNDESLDVMLKSINEESSNRQTPAIETLNRHSIIKLLANW